VRTRNDRDGVEEGRPPHSIAVDESLVRNLSDVRVAIELLRDHLEGLSERIRDLEGQDKTDNFYIQDLMATVNQNETLASSLRKKLDDIFTCVMGKI
jgi:uncharacterized coiled-coil protein SlyX